MRITIEKYRFSRNGFYEFKNLNYIVEIETRYFYSKNDFEKITNYIKNLDELNIGVKIKINHDNVDFCNEFNTDIMVRRFNKLCDDCKTNDGGTDFDAVDKKIVEWVENKQLPDYVRQWIIKYYKLKQ